MRKETVVRKIEAEKAQKKKLSPEAKAKIINKIFANNIIAIIIALCWFLLIIGKASVDQSTIVTYCRTINLIFLLATICLFETAYKKDNLEIALNGIEMMFFSIVAIFVPYICYELNNYILTYFYQIGIYAEIYYIIKSVIIYIKEKKKDINSRNDIKEIIKKESKKEEIDTKREETEVLTSDEKPKNSKGKHMKGE